MTTRHPGLAGAFAVLSFLASSANAQEITTGPVAGIPVDNPWALGLLVLVLTVCAYVMLKRRTHRVALIGLLSLGLAGGLLWQSPDLRAQVVLMFTNPAGETLPIAVSPIMSNGDIAGFAPADFVNQAGDTLLITGITPPTLDQCFPGGAGNLLPPGQPDPDAPAACSVGRTLLAGASCRVDVDSVCRDLAAAAQASIQVTPLVLNLTENGPAQQMTVTNSAGSPVGADNIVATIPGGSSISVQSTTCGAVLAIGASCTIGLVASVAEGPTNVPVAGDNTNTVNVEVTVQSGSTLTAINPASGPASGGTGVTLTGTGLTGATSVTFGGIAATSVNVVNSTTVTAVTPAHAAGVVDVVIDTPAGGATLADGYSYLATAVGQSSGGGTIACLNGGLNNLIAATADNSAGTEWGGFGTAIGAGAQSDTDGAANTAAIVAALGNNGGIPYAAQLCTDYQVDSQGNTPCQAGNTCYNDWFLPAGNNITVTGQLHCLSTNHAAIGGFADAYYWSSTEFTGDFAWAGWSMGPSSVFSNKFLVLRTRCVRAFTP